MGTALKIHSHSSPPILSSLPLGISLIMIALWDFGYNDLELPSFFSSLVQLDTIRYIVNCWDLIPFTKK